MPNQTPFLSDQERIPALIGAAVAASLVLHLLLGLALKEIPLGRSPPPPPEKMVRVEFVDSPRRVAPKQEDLPTNLISDQASAVQDVVPDRDQAGELPRAVGSASSKSVRKVPAGKSVPVSVPEWDPALPEKKQPDAEGTTVRKVRRDNDNPLREPAPAPGDESPFHLRGMDAYLSPESDIPEGKAAILKQVAFNALSPEVARYLARMRPRITNLWHFAILANTFHVRSEKTSLLFKIMPDGKIGKVILNEHRGPEFEMYYAASAIENAQPYEPLNKEILNYIADDGLWLEFNFLYR
jgi:hypothetical protein